MALKVVQEVLEVLYKVCFVVQEGSGTQEEVRNCP